MLINRPSVRRRLLITVILCILGQIYFFIRLSNNGVEFNLSNFDGFIANDIDEINYLAKELHLHFLLIDPLLLPSVDNGTLELRSPTLCTACKSTVLLACEFNDNDKIEKLYERLICQGFEGDLLWTKFENQNITAGLVIRRVSTIVIAFFRTIDGSTWWTGISTTANSINRITLSRIFHEEKLLDKFETSRLTINKRNKQFLYPRAVHTFIENFKTSRFIACNEERAKNFHKKYGKDSSPPARKFRHKAWKLLWRVQTVLNHLGVTFWISSGTCLGYYRECDIIAHSKDVDIGVFAHDYRRDIVTYLEREKIRLTHSFGEVNDSLELSFLDQNNIKLDIFFFYEENETYWNGGTQARTGKKFKYVFPKFELCWTLFLDLKLRVPCDTETYIYANYGPLWNEQIKEWDWKKSPFNVRENGYWPLHKRKFFV